MVRWTSAVAIFTGLLFFVSVLQFLVLRGQLREMKDTRIGGDQSAADQLSVLRQQAATASLQAKALSDAAAAQKLGAETAHETLVASGRAWVGPTDVTLDKVPKITEPLTIILLYQNTGRQPALDVNRFIKVNIVESYSVKEGQPDSRVVENTESCKTSLPSSGQQAAWPTTGFNNFTLTANLDRSPLQTGIQAGNKALAVYGCFAYRTFDRVHRTAYCYYFEPGMTQIEHLNVCQVGNYAD